MVAKKTVHLKKNGEPDNRYRPRLPVHQRSIDKRAKPYPSRAGFQHSETNVKCIRVAIRPAHWRNGPDEMQYWVNAYAEMRACGCHRKKRFNLSRAVPRHSPEEAFHQLCYEVAKLKGFKIVPYQWLKVVPTIRDFEALADEMESEGYDMTGLDI